MYTDTGFIWLVTASLMLWLIVSPNASAETQQTTPTPDLRIVIDVSGSMQRTDPENLRVPALRLLTAQLPAESYAGVWIFGKYVNMLVKHGRVNSAWKEAAAASAAKIQSNAMWTNIGDALKRAAWDAGKPSENADRHILLLTDGRVDIAKDPEINQAEQRKILTRLLPRLISGGIKVHTLALSQEADTSFLQQLSLATGGYHGVVATASELMPFFLKVLDRAAPSEQVPLGSDNRFEIDPGINEFTVLVFREPNADPLLLETPDGKGISLDSAGGGSVNWYQDDRYDLVTVSAPMAGTWQIHGPSDSDNRVTIVTDLKLKAGQLPPSLFGDYEDTLEISLIEDGVRITNPDFLSLVELKASLSSAQGTRELVVAPPLDGTYKLSISGLQEAGDYDLKIEALGKTFKRMLTRSTTLRDPLRIDIRPGDNGGAVIAVELADGNIDYESVRVVGKVDLGTRARLMVASRAPSGLWSLPLKIQQGEIKVSLTIRGEYLTGHSFTITPQPLAIKLPVGDQTSVGLDLKGEPITRQEPIVPAIASAQVAQDTALDEPSPKPSSQASDTPEITSSPMLKVPAWLLWGGVGLLNLLLLAGMWAALKPPQREGGASDGVEPEHPESEDFGLEVALEDFQRLLDEKNPVQPSSGESQAA